MRALFTETEDTNSARSCSTCAMDEDIGDDASLFIGDLSRAINEAELESTFAPYGEISSVEIKRDKSSGHSLGYGFVHFKLRSEALEAKQALHRTAIRNRVVRIGWAQKNTNLFVGDLDGSLDTDGLRNLFRPYGPLYDEETFIKNKNYGFVRFRHRAHAEQAKNELDGRMIGTRAVRIGWGDANMLKSSVHLQFDPKLPSASALTQETVKTFFSQYGKVLSVILPLEEGRQDLKGFGFVHFPDCEEGEQSATAAINEINRTGLLLGVPMMCNHGKRQHARGKRSSPVLSFAPKQRPAQTGVSYSVPVLMPSGPFGSWQAVHYVIQDNQMMYTLPPPPKYQPVRPIPATR
eukprot:JP446437.1.p1 GENE.JP446437.1~~JP446437.1.p1  ORF type:complete len:350 (+),score=37.84 JP446437.1:43-1092(+)